MRKLTSYEVVDANGSVCSFEHDRENSVDMVYDMCKASMQYGQKVAVIKMVRYMLNIGLKEAKYFVEDAWKNA